MARTGLMLLIMLASCAVQAAVYRWVDGKGQVHFSQTPPASGNFEVVRPGAIASPTPANPTEAAPEKSAAPTAAEINAQFLKEAEAANALKSEAQAKSKQARAEEAVKCEAARQRLRFLDEMPARRITTVDSDGNTARLDDDSYLKLKQVAQTDVGLACR
ncbi:MAG: DUF4124 domain-containing protein [Panacagrimonas sp.]